MVVVFVADDGAQLTTFDKWASVAAAARVRSWANT